jgi:hypothetical protein
MVKVREMETVERKARRGEGLWSTCGCFYHSRDVMAE